MPKLRLRKAVTVDQINEMLNANLEGGIVPIEKNIPEIKTKGIYFWYLESQNGYKNLSKFVHVKPIENSQSRIIDGVKYDLVYIGTAGVLKKKESNLTVRLKWHITQEHRESAFSGKNPALSTLRLAIGSLLSDDLIVGNTEKKVNDFIKDNMRVFWIEYPDIKKLINSDETILIEVVKPLINIKHNSNAKKNALNNPTKTYRERRIEVIAATKSRLKGEDKSASKTTKAKNNGGKVPPKKPTANIESEAQKSPKDSNKCVSFNVKQNELAADIADKTIGVPKGKVSIDIFDVETQERLYASHRTNGSRITKLKVAKFFRNQDTNVLPNRAKQVVLQEEMITKKVKEIRVVVCPIGQDNNEPSNVLSPPKRSPVEGLNKKIGKESKSENRGINMTILADKKISEKIQLIDFDKMKDRPKLLIIPCSKSKIDGAEAIDIKDYFLNQNTNNVFDGFLLNRNERMQTYRDLMAEEPGYFTENYGLQFYADALENEDQMPAFERYNGRFYNDELRNLYYWKNNDANLHVLIVSGLFGLLEFRDTIINYHLEISKANPTWLEVDDFILRDTVISYINCNSIRHQDVFYAVSPTNYKPALKPLPEWNDLWINIEGVRSANNAYSARCVQLFLENLL